MSALFTTTGWRVTSPYGPRIHPIYGDRRMHRGIDLVKPAGSPVQAFVPGTVRVIGQGTPGFGGYGIFVVVEDVNRHLHVYAHLSRVVVAVGDTVRIGEILGIQGSTGLSTGPHLHYEIRSRLAPSWGYTSDVDPSRYLAQWLRALPVPGVQQHVQLVMRGELVPQLGLLVGNVTYVPLRWLGERAGLEAAWHDGAVVTVK